MDGNAVERCLEELVEFPGSREVFHGAADALAVFTTSQELCARVIKNKVNNLSSIQIIVDGLDTGHKHHLGSAWAATSTLMNLAELQPNCHERIVQTRGAHLTMECLFTHVADLGCATSCCGVLKYIGGRSIVLISATVSMWPSRSLSKKN